MLDSRLLTLRSPTPEDLPKLAALGRDTFVETFGDLYTPEDLNFFLEEAYHDQVVAEELADPGLTHQIIEYQEQLIAFAKIGPVHVPVDKPAPGSMELGQLYVLREFLGQGLGDKLMTWALDRFAAFNPPELYVSVFSENERAIRFYQKYGFQKCGEYGYPVGNHIDLEWIMKKNRICGNNLALGKSPVL